MAKRKNRLIYQSLGIQVLPIGADGTTADNLKQLYRVQSFSTTSSISFQDINEFGQLAAIDRINLEAPTISGTIEYYITEGFNEEALGFTVNRGTKTDGAWPTNNSFMGDMLEDTSGGLDFFEGIADEGVDLNQFYATDIKPWSLAAGSQETVGILGFGNVYVTDYTVNFSVGELPTASISIEGSNANGVLVSGGEETVKVEAASPEVSLEDGTASTDKVQLNTFRKYRKTEAPAISALRPGDINVKIVEAGTDTEQKKTLIDFSQIGSTGSYIQSVSISVPLAREGLQRLGTKYFYARVVTFPLTATVSISALVNGVNSNVSIADILSTNPKVDVIVSIKNPNDDSKIALEYRIKNCTIDEQPINASIGSNTTADLTLSTQIGSKTDTDNGVFVYSEYTL